MAGVTPVELQSGDARSVRLAVDGHSLALSQDPSSGNHGHVVWDAAGDLARYMLEGSKRRNVRGKRVVEVGSGTGAAGLLLAMAGARVALTDLPSVVPLLAANASRVLGSARVMVHRDVVDDDDDEGGGGGGDSATDTTASDSSETAAAAAAAAGAVGGGDDSWGTVDVGPWDFGKDPPSFLTRDPAEPLSDEVSGSADDVDSGGAETATTTDGAMTGDGPATDGTVTAAGAAAASAAPASADTAEPSSKCVVKPVWPHFIVGSDVLYSESLIDPLLRGVESLMGPSTVAILANERRCEDTYEAFTRACKERFRVRTVPRKQMPPEAPESMFILELRLQRHR